MRCLLAITAFLMVFSISSAQVPRSLPAPAEADPDPLYLIEIIVFAYDAGNRGEEDFFHGLEDRPPGPAPRLFRLPDIELESVSGLRATPAADGFSPVTEPLDDAAAGRTEAVAADPFSTQAIPGDAPDAVPGNSSPELTDRLVLFELDSATGSADVTARLPASFRLVPRAELGLNASRRTLERLQAYTVLGHAGWIQSGVDTDRSVAIDLKRLGITNPTGTIEISVRRFLRAAVDLEFHDGRGTFWTAVPGFGPTTFAYAPSYRLREERTAIRSSDDPAYFDHPLFGMLLHIRPAPEPEDPASGAANGRPAG